MTKHDSVPDKLFRALLATIDVLPAALAAAPVEQLQAWGLRVLSAERADEVVAERS